MNIYFTVVELQIQALEYIPELGRDTSHPKKINNKNRKQTGVTIVNGFSLATV
jgi:hypothetical protein